MNATVPNAPDALSLLPPSGVIQQRLGELAREERILRQLLRLAVRAEQELKGCTAGREGSPHAA